MKKYKYKGETVTPMCNIDTGIYIRESDKVALCLLPSEVEEVVEPKQYSYGDILYHETNPYKWVFIFTDTCDDGYEGLSCVCVDDDDYYDEYRNVSTPDIRIATPAEQQLLFSALAKEGKYWDAEAKEVKDFERVPESVGIYKSIVNLQSKSVYDRGDGLYIGFNNGSQTLSTSDGFYHVQPFNSDWFEKVQCYLQPIKKEDLKAGDTVYVNTKEDYNADLTHYYKSLGGIEVARVGFDGKSVTRTSLCADVGLYIYKLIPIQ